MKSLRTQLTSARQGRITPEMRHVAETEKISAGKLRSRIANGRIVIPWNTGHRPVAMGIGQGLRTKVNANIGTSPVKQSLSYELKKLKAAVKAGADTVMDLSTGGNLRHIRRRIVMSSRLPVGTVPIYQASVEACKSGRGVVDMTADDMFSVIEQHAEDGVDYITVHCGVTMSVLKTLRKSKRLTGIVSRGGAILAGWIMHNGKENPLYEQFDRLLEIAGKYDVTLSLGDGLRPGSLADASDRPQIQELITLGKLAKRARAYGVQAIIEGPGHIPVNQIEMNVRMEKKLCNHAPFYILGPLVTDIAPGYDHITSAIGGAIAGAAGADFLCYVTSSEHLGLPDVESVRQGVIAARIAAHAADIAKGIPGAVEWDFRMSRARKDLDWLSQMKVSIDPEPVAKLIKSRRTRKGNPCTMCGEFCSMKLFRKNFTDAGKFAKLKPGKKE